MVSRDPRAVRRGARHAVLAALAVVLSLTPSTAHADWHLSPFFGMSFKGHTTLVDPENGAAQRHWVFGGTGGFLSRGWFGAEGHFLLAPGFFENDETSLIESSAAVAGMQALPVITHSRVTTLMGNVIVAAPLGWNEFGLRPYVSGGLGLMRAVQSGPFEVNVNMLAFDVGGGAEGPLSDHTALRFDVRFFRNLTHPEQEGISFNDASLRFWTASVGFVFRWPQRGPRPPGG